MKILYVTPGNPWPTTNGGKIRCANIIRGLASNHEVTLAIANHKPQYMATDVPDDVKVKDVVVLGDDCPTLVKRLWGKMRYPYRHVLNPSQKHRYRASFLELEKQLQPDLVWYFQDYAIWPVGIPALTRSVLDMDNIESAVYQRLASAGSPFRRLMTLTDLKCFIHTEQQIAKECDLVVLSSNVGAGSLSDLTQVEIVPNGFDFSTPPHIRPKSEPRLLFVGWLEYRPNLDGVEWFCQSVWPHILRQAPNACLDIIGKYPPAAKTLENISGIRLHGFVDDLTPYWENASVFVVPLLSGGGTRIKILEAWSMGMPVVSTSVGCEGLGAVDGNTILKADSDMAFAEKCLDIIASPDQGMALANAAYDYGKRQFDWKVVYEHLDSLVKSVNHTKDEN